MAFAGKKRKVLFIVENLPSPFDRRVWQEATTLEKAGYVVSIICPTGKGQVEVGATTASRKRTLIDEVPQPPGTQRAAKRDFRQG